MPEYRDAVGYLLELRDTRNEPWFSKAADLAVAAGSDEFGPDDVEAVEQLFFSQTTYTAIATTPASPAATPAISSSAFLKRVGSFTNFKKLDPTLEIAFHKRVTLVFGKNGTGKSSICQAMKTLADPIEPDGPLNNVHRNFPSEPSFEYQFEGEPAATTWQRGTGYGAEANRLMYFDTHVALANTSNPMDPSRSVELTPFRLEAFDYLRSLVTAIQTSARQAICVEREQLERNAEALLTRLGDIADPESDPFASLLRLLPAPLKQLITELPPVDVAHALKVASLQAEVTQLTEASSESGLRSLRDRRDAFARFKRDLDLITTSIDRINPRLRIEQEQARDQKQSALRELNSHCFPEGADPVDVQALVNAGSRLADYEQAQGGQGRCPLCNRIHDSGSAEQFQAYHGLLTSSLTREVQELESALNTTRQDIAELKRHQQDDYAGLAQDLPEGEPENALATARTLIDVLPEAEASFSGINLDVFAGIESVRTLAEHVATHCLQLDESFKAAEQGGEALAQKLEAAKAELAKMRLEQVLSEYLEEANALIGECEAFQGRSTRLHDYDFTSLLRTMTNKGRQAHEELVLSEFEQRLNSEYEKLSDKTMQAFGVRLRPAGSQQAVAIHPEIGGSGVHRVLSEGEQKVHALAAFICEAGLSPDRVIVFDDPVTSFDYDYINNFCKRLRDFVIENSQTQIVVLTHNWDFFVNLQLTLNSGGLSNHLNVQILESCKSVRTYEENEHALIDEVNCLLGTSGEPSEQDKAEAARVMRILIEVIVNTHVFNKLRQQFKQRRQNASVFTDCVKIVPLNLAEANRLRDLYGELSAFDHDDPRTAYTNRTGGQMRRWFTDIMAIRDAVIRRRPS
ncbi:MAG: AAA family ATPase [Planctomycetota bacterium]